MRHAYRANIPLSCRSKKETLNCNHVQFETQVGTSHRFQSALQFPRYRYIGKKIGRREREAEKSSQQSTQGPTYWPGVFYLKAAN